MVIFSLVYASLSMSILLSTAWSNSSSASTYSSFDKSSLKPGAKALQFSLNIFVHTYAFPLFARETTVAC